MNQSTTLILSIKILPEAADTFSHWQEEMNSTVSMFPGFVSFEVQLPQQPTQPNTINVQRFRTKEDLDAWRASTKLKQLLDELKPLLPKDDESAIREIDPTFYHQQESVTEVFVSQVKPDMHESYKEWAGKIHKVESQFFGFQSFYIQSPAEGQGDDWITMVKFDTPEHLEVWLNSKERASLLKEGEALVEKLQSHQVISPFTGWFPSTLNAENPPSRWKQTMLILLVLFPIVMFEIKFLLPNVKQFGHSPATFIGNAISVSLIAWPFLPFVISLLGWWLSPSPKNRIRNTILGTLLILLLYLIEIVSLWNLI